MSTITSIIQGIYHLDHSLPLQIIVTVTCQVWLTKMDYGTEKLNNRKKTGKIEKSGQSQGSTDDVFPGGLDCKTVGFFFLLKISKEIGKAWLMSLKRAKLASLKQPRSRPFV